MYESMLNFPSDVFGDFGRLRRGLDRVHGDVAGIPVAIVQFAATTVETHCADPPDRLAVCTRCFGYTQLRVAITHSQVPCHVPATA